MFKKKESGFKLIWNELAGVQKPKNNGYLYTIYINRPVGRFFAVVAHQFGLTPNQVSLISFALSLIGLGFLIIFGYQSVFGSFIGVLILLLGFALDSSDGQLARLIGVKSSAREWLDAALDSLKYPLFHLSIVFTIYQINPSLNKWAFFLCMIVSAFFSAKFFSTEIKRRIFFRNERDYPPLGKLKGVLLSGLDYGVLCFLFLLAPFGILFETYVCWGTFYIVFCFFSLSRSFYQLKVLDAQKQGASI